jgi:hypothetical protein
MRLRHLILTLALFLPTVLPTPATAADLPMSVDEFKLWRDYLAALEDPRVQKMPEKQRLPAIARNFKVSEKVLRKAISSGEQHGADMGRLSEEAIRAAFGDTEIGPRIKELRVDASAAHVITYLTWLGERPELLEREACLAAARIQKASPLTSTIKLEVIDPLDGERKLFEGLISAQNASRIKERSIVDFASTRYIKLFEKVARAGH